MSLLKKLLHEPLLHFLVIGALLFVFYGLKNEGLNVDDKQIIISQDDITYLSKQWQRKWQRPPSDIELQSLIEHQIREEVMYREALVLGFEHNDPVIRRRLAQKMSFIADDLAEQIAPSDEDLISYLHDNKSQFELPARLSFVHIYFSVDKRGAKATADAESLLAQLQHTEEHEDITILGDAFMVSQQQNQQSEQEVARLFGSDFARELFEQNNHIWQGVLRSAYGLHLVRIEEKTPAKLPELDQVKDKLRNAWLAEQRATMNKNLYESFRSQYQVIVQGQVIENDVSISSQ